MRLKEMEVWTELEVYFGMDTGVIVSESVIYCEDK